MLLFCDRLSFACCLPLQLQKAEQDAAQPAPAAPAAAGGAAAPSQTTQQQPQQQLYQQQQQQQQPPPTNHFSPPEQQQQMAHQAAASPPAAAAPPPEQQQPQHPAQPAVINLTYISGWHNCFIHYSVDDKREIVVMLTLNDVDDDDHGADR